jgi:hypothetical protein
MMSIVSSASLRCHYILSYKSNPHHTVEVCHARQYRGNLHTHNEADIKLLNSGVASALLERMLLWTGLLSGFVNIFFSPVVRCTTYTSRCTRQLHNRKRRRPAAVFNFVLGDTYQLYDTLRFVCVSISTPLSLENVLRLHT